MQKPNCRCDEASYVSKYGEEIRQRNSPHDCEYIAFRNGLIPEASELANSRSGPSHVAGWTWRWSREFTHAMDELWERRKVDFKG